ncbi:MAG: beta-N-acetylhexosaminidase [Acidobacteriota bacterium]|nr:beta-N-acetylhexosaminidase [Acidobacteriota bacterium]
MALSFAKLTWTLWACAWLASAAIVSPLYQRGYTVLPEPQKAILGSRDFPFGTDWRIETGPGVKAGHPAIAAFQEDLDTRFQLRLGAKRSGAGALRFEMAAGSVKIGAAQDKDKEALAAQAYKIDLAPGRITVAANAPPGLFYGAETLVQLLRPRNGSLWLPEGHIEDWPDLQLRQIYWDDAHHLDRPEALKKAIRQAAFFKINGFALKLEGHFDFKSAHAVVEPQALSPAEFQDLTDYALRYHVQLIPYLDGPGHIAFILKHPEYARLREYPDSNYELCATNPDSYKLLFGMFQDLIDANKGVKYFYLSTDEPYYVGMANNSQCQEGARAKELGSVGKVLAEFVTKTSDYLHSRGRTVIFWGEYPMKPDDLASLPSHIVNGEVYGPQFDPVFKKLGIKEMIYTATEGEEKFFPEYFASPASERLHSGRPASERVNETFRKIAFDSARRDADLMGMLNAGWADMGLHPETFWLGYAAAASAGWHPGSPDPRESVSTFYPLFYGPNVAGMDRLYQLMSTQAQVWSDSWDPMESTARKGIWGNSNGIYDKRRPARDQTIPLPPAPAANLSYRSDWGQANSKRLQTAEASRVNNDELMGLLLENLRRASLNRYNLSVYLSIANLYRQNLDMLRSIGAMDELLKTASSEAEKDRPKQAIAAVDQALEVARTIELNRNRSLRDATATWEETWYPRVLERNGRRYLHELDDVKDHLPDRTTGMSYLVYRELLLPFGEWIDRIQTARNDYARAHQLGARTDKFDWNDLKTVAASEAGEIPLE